MGERRVMEVLRSRSHKYEIVRVDWGMLGITSYKFFVMCDGREAAGAYSDYHDAVAWARKQGAS